MNEILKMISKLESEKQKKTAKRNELDEEILLISSQLKELYSTRTQLEKLNQAKNDLLKKIKLGDKNDVKI